MGEKTGEALKLQFDKRLRLEFHGARITSDAGLLAFQELDKALESRQLNAGRVDRNRKFKLPVGNFKNTY